MGGFYFSWFDEAFPWEAPTAGALQWTSPKSATAPMTVTAENAKAVASSDIFPFTPFIICPGQERIYFIIPELEQPPWPPWPPFLPPPPPKVAKLTRRVQRKVARLTRRWNRMAKKMQKVADRVTRGLGDDLSRHVVLAMDRKGNVHLRLSAAVARHDHYDVADALSKAKRPGLKSVPDTAHMSPGRK